MEKRYFGVVVICLSVCCNEPAPSGSNLVNERRQLKKPTPHIDQGVRDVGVTPSLWSHTKYTKEPSATADAPPAFRVQLDISGTNGYRLHGFSADGKVFAFESYGTLMNTGFGFRQYELVAAPGYRIIDSLRLTAFGGQIPNEARGLHWLKQHGIHPSKLTLLSVRKEKNKQLCHIAWKNSELLTAILTPSSASEPSCEKRGGQRQRLAVSFPTDTGAKYRTLFTEHERFGGTCVRNCGVVGAYCARNTLGLVLACQSLSKGATVNHVHSLFIADSLPLPSVCE